MLPDINCWGLISRKLGMAYALLINVLLLLFTFWIGNILLIAPFPGYCLLVHFTAINLALLLVIVMYRHGATYTYQHVTRCSPSKRLHILQHGSNWNLTRLFRI